MKNILHLLKFGKPIGRKSVSSIMQERESADKIVARIPDGPAIRESDMKELHYIQVMGAYHHEQLEAFAARACNVVGVDPNGPSIETDWCNEIVFARQDPCLVINQIISRRDRRANEVTS